MPDVDVVDQEMPNQMGGDASPAEAAAKSDQPGHANMDIVMQIPVAVQALLGTVTMPVSRLMQLAPGSVVVLDHYVGDPIDVTVNGRTIARGEVVVLDDDTSRFGISLTEIIDAKLPRKANI